MDLRRREFAALMLGGAAALSLAGRADAESDPLPSWNAGPAKDAIVKFVHATTDAASPDFVPLAERIATFDQDGTLWVEHPIYTQLVYSLRSRAGAREGEARACQGRAASAPC